MERGRIVGSSSDGIKKKKEKKWTERREEMKQGTGRGFIKLETSNDYGAGRVAL